MMASHKTQEPEITAEQARCPEGHLLDGWGLPVNLLRRADALTLLEMPDPENDPEAWSAVEPVAPQNAPATKAAAKPKPVAAPKKAEPKVPAPQLDAPPLVLEPVHTPAPLLPPVEDA